MQATVAVVAPADRRLPIVAAWLTVLLVSDLPDILWNAAVGRLPDWPPAAKAAVPALLLVLCLTWRRLRVLWQFACVMLVFYLALSVSAWVGASAGWRGRFVGPQVSFAVGYVGIYLRDGGVALAVLATLWMIKRDRRLFFLAKGDLRARVGPVR